MNLRLAVADVASVGTMANSCKMKLAMGTMCCPYKSNLLAQRYSLVFSSFQISMSISIFADLWGRAVMETLGWSEEIAGANPWIGTINRSSSRHLRNEMYRILDKTVGCNFAE